MLYRIFPAVVSGKVKAEQRGPQVMVETSKGDLFLMKNSLISEEAAIARVETYRQLHSLGRFTREFEQRFTQLKNFKLMKGAE